MDELDELYVIRQRVTPEEYLAGLRRNMAVYKEQLAAALAELDSFAADETLPVRTREALVEERKLNARSLHFRIVDAERRQREAAEAARGEVGRGDDS